jgi:hypothetical protein
MVMFRIFHLPYPQAANPLRLNSYGATVGGTIQPTT